MQAITTDRGSNKFPQSTSLLDLSNKQVSNHNYMDNDLDSKNRNTTVSSASNNSNTYTTPSISQIQDNLLNQNLVLEYNTNQTYKDILQQAQKRYNNQIA